MDFVEFEQFGINALTISFFISIGLTLLTGWGLVQQNRTIRNGRNAEAVSIIWMSYYAVLQIVIFTYGISLDSLALMINGLLAVLYLPILAGLNKFKGFRQTDIVAMSLFIAGLIGMILLPYKAMFFLIFAIGGLFSAATQPFEMWQKKSARGLNVKLVGIMIFGNVVWLVYGLAISDWVLITINLIAFVLFSVTTVLAKIYRKGN